MRVVGHDLALAWGQPVQHSTSAMAQVNTASPINFGIVHVGDMVKLADSTTKCISWHCDGWRANIEHSARHIQKKLA